MYYIMKRDPANVGGMTKIKTCRTLEAADRAAAAMDGKINGRPAGWTAVWTEQEYKEWQEANIQPYYR